MTKKWLKASLIRALKTFCQGLVTMIGADYISIVELDWKTMLGMASTMALVSILTSVAGLPEVPKVEEGEADE